MPKPTFDVDKQGLAKLIRKRGVAVAVVELLQNAFDENTTRVEVQLERVTGRTVRLVVEDDNPEGFQDLSHAYTLFAESAKKNNPEQRGRFNLGEKLVVAICQRAEISTTKGTIVFEGPARFHRQSKRAAGSRFEGEITMTRAEVDEVTRVLRTIIVPPEIALYFQGSLVPRRSPLETIEISLPTVKTDEEGNLSPTRRFTRVDIYEPLPDEPPRIFEMGLPIVENESRYDINVGQKVPLNMNRDNVTPAYLREVRTAVLNHMHEELSEDEVTDSWIGNALEDPDVDPEAVESVLEKRYGAQRVIHDPSDPEANRIAMSQGYTVIPGRSFNKRQWKNIRTSKAAQPAGQVTPSPKPFSPDGRPLNLMERRHWTPGVAQFVAYAEMIAVKTIGRTIRVKVANDPGWGFGGAFGPDGTLYVNVTRKGYRWFEEGLTPAWDDFLIHEFGHKDGADHLDFEYHRALTAIGAAFARINREEPEAIRPFRLPRKEAL